jgi:histidinol dehydrogenase
MKLLNLSVPAGTRISELTEQQRTNLCTRGRAQDEEVSRAVTELIAEVRAHGDAALREHARRFDGVENLTLEVPRAQWGNALESLDAELRAGLLLAARNIATFHQAQMPAPLELELRPGLRLGRRADPLQNVAVYAPGGRAAYPSSVLMGAVPAQVAGVQQVIVCSPAGRSGLPPAAVLAACEIANADRVFAIGGAGAIAAVAYGTETVPRVEKVVGPGNVFVTEAKRQLNGIVAIDCPAGPSEVLVLADETADAQLVAFELLAQAEHDPDAATVLVTTSAELLTNVAAILSGSIAKQPRSDLITSSFSSCGALLLAASNYEMLAFSQEYAPEHLCLYVAEPRALLQSVRNAGTVFLGSPSSVVFGDYLTGANHVLPTGTLARAYSGLSTIDFLRTTTYQELSKELAEEYAPITATLALAEGLPAHAAAVKLRGRTR